MSSSVPVLYSMDISPPCRFVLMTIQALNLDVEIKNVDLMKGENRSDDYVKLNPMRKVPTLCHNDVILTDSHAICTYLVARFSPNSKLYPQSPTSRALVDQMLSFNMCQLFPKNSAIMCDFFKNGRDRQNPDLVSEMKEAFGYLDKFCKKSKWLAGEKLTLADLCCGATVSSAALMVPLDEDAYPAAAEWFARCNEEPVFKLSNQPGVDNLKTYLGSWNLQK